MARSGANMVVPLTALSLSVADPRINPFRRPGRYRGCIDFTIRAAGRARYSRDWLENPK
jgi:hypothetical protein